MSKKSAILTHPKRLEIERAVMRGESIAKIAVDYGVSADCLRNFVDRHLPRQLVQAWNKKELDRNLDLLEEVDEIIAKAKAIFERNYENGRDLTALKALGEQRSTIELLCKVSAYMHQSKVIELEQQKESFRYEQNEAFSDRLKILTLGELEMLHKIQEKLLSQNPKMIIIPDSKEFVHIKADNAMKSKEQRTTQLKQTEAEKQLDSADVTVSEDKREDSTKQTTKEQFYINGVPQEDAEMDILPSVKREHFKRRQRAMDDQETLKSIERLNRGL